jgi:hypothetical protein
MTLLGLELRFERGQTPGSYRVVARGLGAGATGRFTQPFTDVELENFVLKIGRRTAVRRVQSPESQLAKQFGARLFSAVFEGDVREVYRSSLQEAQSVRKPLRVTLSLTETPELLRLPWEYLYDEPDFLAISRWTPVVRYLDIGKPLPPLQMTLPLRILSLISAPQDAEPIDAAKERTRLTTALAPLVEAGAVAIDWLPRPSLLGLTRQLEKQDYHVIHYIGHGGYDDVVEDGVLLFEDDEGRSDRVRGEQLGELLRDQLTLRLAVLNACEGARASVDDPFSGVATSLIHRGIPSVIGMQFEISDRAAILFAADFYTAVAEGRPIDTAMAQARRAIYADHNYLEWGTPVLFMRVQDGRLFDVAEHAPIPAPSHDALLETAAHVGLLVHDEEPAAAAQGTQGAGAPPEPRVPPVEERPPSPDVPAKEAPRPERPRSNLSGEGRPPAPAPDPTEPSIPPVRSRGRPTPRPQAPGRRTDDRPPYALIGLAGMVLAGAVVVFIVINDGRDDGGSDNGATPVATAAGGGGNGATPAATAARISMPDVYMDPLDAALAAVVRAGFTTEPRIEEVCSGRLEGMPGIVREVLIDVGAPDGMPSDPANRLVGAPGEQLRSELRIAPATRLHVKVASGERC